MGREDIVGLEAVKYGDCLYEMLRCVVSSLMRLTMNAVLTPMSAALVT